MCVFILACLPAVHALFTGLRGTFWYLATDSFYYLTVARNYNETGLFSFDKQHVTNGFHPLWQFWLIGAHRIALLFPDHATAFIRITFISCQVLFAAAVTVFAAALARHACRMIPLLTMIPFGIYAVIGWLYQPRFSTQWDSVNGMETSLSLLFVAVMIAFLLRETIAWARPVVTGILVGVLILSRLDLVFILPALAAITLYDHRLVPKERRTDILFRGALGLTLSGVILGTYLLWNKSAFGVWAPVSGAQKSSFPNWEVNNAANFNLLFSSLGLTEELSSVLRWRIAQMYIPALLCIGYLLYSASAGQRQRRDAAGQSSALHRTALFAAVWVLMVHGYNILFVRAIHQGYWYYGVTILLLWLPVLDVVIHNVRINRKFSRKQVRVSVIMAACLFQVGYFLLVFVRSTYVASGLENELKDLNYRAYAGRGEAIKHFSGKVPPFVEVDDGILAYSLDSPAVSGIGLCLDIEGHRLIEQGAARDVLDLAYQRGIRHLGSCNYLRDAIFYTNPSDEALTLHMRKRLDFGLSYASYKWSMEYAAPDRSFFIMSFDK